MLFPPARPTTTTSAGDCKSVLLRCGIMIGVVSEVFDAIVPRYDASMCSRRSPSAKIFTLLPNNHQCSRMSSPGLKHRVVIARGRGLSLAVPDNTATGPRP